MTMNIIKRFFGIIFVILSFFTMTAVAIGHFIELTKSQVALAASMTVLIILLAIRRALR